MLNRSMNEVRRALQVTEDNWGYLWGEELNMKVLRPKCVWHIWRTGWRTQANSQNVRGTHHPYSQKWKFAPAPSSQFLSLAFRALFSLVPVSALIFSQLFSLFNIHSLAQWTSPGFVWPPSLWVSPAAGAPWLLLKQWFSTVGSFVSKVHLAMSPDFFGCLCWRDSE